MLKDYKGACHIHTEYSDGSIPVSDVIKSAQDADLTYECQKESGKYDRYFEQLGFDPKVARNVLKHMSNKHKFCKIL